MQNNQPFTHDGLRALSVDIENFKNIDKMIVDIGGRSLLVLGSNGAGKSSFIQAIMSPLSAKELPSVPIKAGEERAKISLKLGGSLDGEYKEYTLDMFFTPKDNTGRLVVYNDKGEKIPASKTFVKDLIGNISFDVMTWLHGDKKKRHEIIVNASGCKKEVDIINMDIADLKKDQKYKKERAEQLEGAVKSHEFTREEIDLYSNPIDLVPIQEKYNKVSAAQKQWDDIKAKTQSFDMAVNGYTVKINDANAEIKRLQDLIEAQMNNIIVMEGEREKANINLEKGTKWLNANPRPSTDEVVVEMNSATEHNSKHARIGMLSNQQREMIQLKDQVEEVKLAISAKEEQRNQVIANSQLPIKGFSFTDEELFLNGLPLEEGQQNKTQLFDIGIEVAMALNPNLRIIFLHDGSLYDREHLKTIISHIESKGYMAIAEVVSNDGDPLHVEFVEKAL